MRRIFPSSGMRYRYHLWRDRRRYPWHYAEVGSVKRSKATSRMLRWRLFVVRYTPGDPDVFILAECPDYATAVAIATKGHHVFTQGQMLDTPKLRRALMAWDASMNGRRVHRAPSRISRRIVPPHGAGVGLSR